MKDANKIRKLLPWDPKFDLKEFIKPEFSSLHAICFACSGTPIAVNLPNINEVRLQGFKNISFQNAYP